MLGQDQQIMDTRIDFVQPHHTERGGVLSLATLSGIQYAVYEFNPTTSTVPLGIQQHDVEEVDVFRALAPWNVRRAYPPFTPYPYIIRGSVITNAVHPHIDPACVRPGAPAYLAPSGLITCVPTYNSKVIGTFMCQLNDSTLSIPASAGPSLLRVGGVESIVNPQPVLVPTAGWVKINVDFT